MSNGHNGTVFRVLYPKISTGQEKLAPTGRHGRHVFATLATKMMTIASTILLLQEMKILPTEMYCERCEAISPDVFKLRGNFGFFKCSTCKSMKSIRDNTVLSNSNLQLKRFVGLLWSFSEDRGRNYKEIINETMKQFFPQAGPYNLEQKIMLFLYFKNQKAYFGLL